LWGYRNDGDAGLLHVSARYYEVETGRWVQKDPLDNVINPKNLNKYVYCVNDPINWIDPIGKDPLSSYRKYAEWLMGGIGAVIGGIGGGPIGMVIGGVIGVMLCDVIFAVGGKIGTPAGHYNYP
jgi:RHS repeat-associated protein